MITKIKSSIATFSEERTDCVFCPPRVKQPTIRVVLLIGKSIDYTCTHCFTRYFMLKGEPVAWCSELLLPEKQRKRPTGKDERLYQKAVDEEWYRNRDLKNLGIEEGVWTMAIEVLARVVLKKRNGVAPNFIVGRELAGMSQQELKNHDNFIKSLQYLKKEGYVE